MYYSPIGDGVVAADGVELKRVPRDLTPRVSVIHQQYTEKGTPGHDGVRIVEKQWTSGGDTGSQASGHRSASEIGGHFPDSGRESRATTAPSPFSAMGDPLGLSSHPTGPGTSGLGRPASNAGVKSPSHDPYGTLDSLRSAGPKNDYLNGLRTNDNDYPHSGRTSSEYH